MLVLDECHNAKTSTKSSGGASAASLSSASSTSSRKKISMSKTAQTVTDLQSRLPNARVVYSSATGGSDEKELGYMQRLGLWGPGTSYKSFADLAAKLSNGGLSFLEMLCCDIKAKGAFLSRQLSFSGCQFLVKESGMAKEMSEMYLRSVQLWRRIFEAFKKAMKVGSGDRRHAQLVEPFAKYARGSKKSDGDLDDDAYESEEDVVLPMAADA